VVLVDDDNDVLTVLKQNLEANNYQVYAFDSPIKALEYIQSTNSPQLLITDIRMPGMSGFELARQVNSHKPEMMIMLLTSFEINWSEFEKVFPSARIDALVKKPISTKKLIDAVNALVVGSYDKARKKP
jgi:CheY-like chemotaxis protein